MYIGAKQEEDTLLDEMDSTGQAFEHMQEQNTRLLSQLKEKDDANFKLMTEVRYISISPVFAVEIVLVAEDSSQPAAAQSDEGV